MKFKSLLSTMALITAVAGLRAQEISDDVIMLNLSEATTDLTFDEINGMWSDNFDEDATEIDSQVFSIVHGCISDYNYWYGFTASNSTDNSYQANTLLYQYSNMAKGGILIDEKGFIQKNEFGSPMTGQDMPYLVGFPKSEITFNTGKSYEVVGAYFNLNTYTFYSILYGDGYARAFTEGDKLTLIVHGVNSDENENTVEITLASFSNGCLNANTGWQYVDLSSLGVVEELYFTMKSTDSGQWGMNTPSYFCMDKLMVKEAENSSIISLPVSEGKTDINYDSASKTINLSSPMFAIVYDTMGHKIMSSEDTANFSVEHLDAGIYVVKAGSSSLKFAR